MTNKTWNDKPPGSPQAVESGCKCPVIDNARGKGRGALEEDWFISEQCIMHRADGVINRIAGLVEKDSDD